ncbi:hypothetical protein ABNG02_05075 [Halorubrum ejinorense]|uniref:DUF8135 domain-containing protein n=1 Tax=Halorubrum ejinorense TaxID=425309 RepID=A0AAV3SX15_9EURY
MSDDEPDDEFEAPDSDEVDDPFAALGDGVDDGDLGDETGLEETGFDDGDDSDDLGLGRSTDAADRADPAPAATDEDPFAELDADAGDADGGDPFESMEVGDVGDEDVWDALDEEGSVGADAGTFDDHEAGAAADASTRFPGAAGPPEAGDERVIDKRSYCQQCPHFAEPPETACTHEGTDIVESVDFSRFRVRNCPIVEANDPAFDGE